jgi:hypothetical protein
MSTILIAVEIDEQIKLLHRARSVSPRLGRHLVGTSKFEAPIFRREGDLPYGESGCWRTRR